MDPLSMEKAMMKNMIDKTGKSIEEWIGIVNEQQSITDNDIVNFLKEKHSLGHFYAHLIVRKSK